MYIRNRKSRYYGSWIKKAYFSDLGSFTTRSEKPKIIFVVQSSLTKMPFSEKTIDTMILSMILQLIFRLVLEYTPIQQLSNS